MPDDQDHSRKMQKQTSETRRWGSHRPPHLETQEQRTTKSCTPTTQQMITGTPSSCMMEFLVGYTKLPYENHKGGKNSVRACERFLLSFQKPRRVYTDTSREFIKPCQSYSGPLKTNNPQRSETQGTERESCSTRKKERTSMAMVQSSFPKDWWDFSMKCKKSLAKRARQCGRWQDSIREKM